jgi:RNA polymerase sigma-70 factor (ECF subfamily)
VATGGRPRRDGRVRRFEAQILPHLADLYRAARRLGATPSDAEDLVQETCLRAFQSLDQLKHHEAAKAWVFAVLRSIFLRHAARISPTTVEHLADPEAWPLPPGAPGDRAEEGGATLLDVREAVGRLPLAYREALVLAHVGGFSYQEIARILEVPIGTVMSRLFRARRLVRHLLREIPHPPCSAESRR